MWWKKMIQYKNIKIVKKGKYPKIYSGQYCIGELHKEYVAFTEQKEMEFHFNDIQQLAICLLLYQQKYPKVKNED